MKNIKDFIQEIEQKEILKRRKKKTKTYKKYTIEREKWGWFGETKEWEVHSRYETKKQRNEAFKALNKNRYGGEFRKGIYGLSRRSAVIESMLNDEEL